MFNKELLLKSVEEYGLSLSDFQCSQFEKYSCLLKEWNEKVNLTAITDEDEIIVKHFADSLSIYPYLHEKSSLIDVGTGAGFPGIPLKIVNPDISLTLLDALEKRLKFLNAVMESIRAADYSCVHSRAEDLGRDSLYREKYDVCTARAVAKLPVLLELCLPFVKKGGIFIALKGVDREEISDSEKALEILGGEIVLTKELELFENMGRRTVIIIKKIRQLSTKFPRNYSKILKNPLK